MEQFSRYEKQILFNPLNEDGQQKLANSTVGVLGVGALGTNISNLLVRAGIGKIIIADYDKIELVNLHRQMLFDEQNVGQYKAAVAAQKLKKINSQVEIEHHCVKVSEHNFKEIFGGVDLIMDATDNFTIRLLINQMCLDLDISWVHTGVTASSGQSMLVRPNKGPCYACLVPEEPDMNNYPSMDTDGILAVTVTTASSISVATAFKYLTDQIERSFLYYFDIWNMDSGKIKVERSVSCKYCNA